MALKFYYDDASQPCRAVHVMLDANNIPYEGVYVSLGKGEHRTNEELRKINPNSSLPTIDDNGFSLFESAAILTYLVDKYHLPDHWYPKDLQKRAKINEYLHWHHNYLRREAKLFYYKCLYCIWNDGEPEPALVSECEETLKKSLTRLNDHFLKDSKFIYGDEMSVADLQALCELTQSWMADKRFEDDYPNLKRWVADCQKELGEPFDEAHKFVYHARDTKMFGDRQP